MQNDELSLELPTEIFESRLGRKLPPLSEEGDIGYLIPYLSREQRMGC
jgi:hypothetical protein